MNTNNIANKLLGVLDENKALDIQRLDVGNYTSITDTMIIASGRSARQVKSLADKIIVSAKELGMPPLGVEGKSQGEWILIDLGDIILHLMQPTTRLYYQLEKLWSGDSQESALPS